MSRARTVAVGFDGSTDAETAVRWSLALASSTGADVVVVHAVGLLEHMRTKLAREVTPPTIVTMMRELDFDERRLHLRIDDGDACSVLLRASAAPIDADVIVVGSRGSEKRAGMLLGSTSLEVAEHASIPVVIVPSSYVERQMG